MQLRGGSAAMPELGCLGKGGCRAAGCSGHWYLSLVHPQCCPVEKEEETHVVSVILGVTVSQLLAFKGTCPFHPSCCHSASPGPSRKEGGFVDKIWGS